MVTNREGKHPETNLRHHALPGPPLSSNGKPHPADVGNIKAYLHRGSASAVHDAKPAALELKN